MSSIFTKIINGEIPSFKIAENENCFAFLDINPNSKGHTLCVLKKEVDRGRGVISDPQIWEEVLKNVQDSINTYDGAIIECMPSPIKGSEGNVEFFLHVTPETQQGELEISKVVSLAIEQREN